MAKKLIVIAVLVVALVAGCNSAVLGNIAVLAIGIGIFIGTLSLGGQVAKSVPIGNRTERMNTLSSNPAPDFEFIDNG
jgi:hypothetical protein